MGAAASFPTSGLARAHAVGLTGIAGQVVEVEAHLAAGTPAFAVTGLPDAAVREARDRIKAAIVNSRVEWPNRRITVGLSPASLPKHGTGYDLAMAASLLAAAGQLPADPLGGYLLVGELGLDGRVRSLPGVLPMVHTAARAGLRTVMVPAAHAAEAALVPEVRVYGVGTLAEAVALLRGEAVVEPHARPPAWADPDGPDGPVDGPDLADVVGQEIGRRALEVAAAGGHHLFLIGPPGAGKTLLAERLPGLLPPLDEVAALEVTAVHSVAGMLPDLAALVRKPPYQAPHHTASMAALVGGGAGLARPGMISLAHQGVLFIDEAPEFKAGTLDALRQPLEAGEVHLARTLGVIRYPARFQLVLAANPCPCTDPRGDDACTCPPLSRRRYLTRLSGPLLDRVDLQVELLPVRRSAVLDDGPPAEGTAAVRRRVAAARTAAAARWHGMAWRTNARAPGSALRGSWRLPRAVTADADRGLDLGRLSLRGYDRVLRVAWTAADLAGRDRPDADDVGEAYALRTRTVATAGTVRAVAG
jgi:magnesium chelatase family protein